MWLGLRNARGHLLSSRPPSRRQLAIERDIRDEGPGGALEPTDPSRGAEPLIGGRFRIVEPIATGGMGSVFRAVQEPLGREVAVKIVRTDLHPDQVADFKRRILREAEQLGRLSHPHVVTVYDYGLTPDDRPYIAMELLEGRTLRQRLKEERVLAADEAVRLTVGMARGLRHAHAQGMVHRDIKPSNVFLRRDDEGTEQPVLLDFGLVKLSDGDDDENLTLTTHMMGTPQYMSPEQALGKKDIDNRADLYALGCLLYRMLTGRVPFKGEGPLATAMLHVQEPIPPMAERNPHVEVDPALESIVRQSMEKDRDSRFSTAQSLLDALSDWQGEEVPRTLIAEPPALPRRRWGPWLLAGAGGTALLGIAVFATRGPEPAPPRPSGPALAEALGAPTPAPSTPAPVEPPEPPVETPPAPAPTHPREPSAAVRVGSPPSHPAASEAASPTPAIAPSPAPEPSPAPAPKPPAPEDASEVLVYADTVPFTPTQAERTLAFVNEASPAQLEYARVYERGVEVIMEERPFSSLQQFAETPWIGEKTVMVVKEAALR